MLYYNRLKDYATLRNVSCRWVQSRIRPSTVLLAATKSSDPAKNNTAVPAHQAVLCFTVGVPVNISVIIEPACRLAVVIAFIWVLPVMTNRFQSQPRVRLLAAAISAPLSVSNLLFIVTLCCVSFTVMSVELPNKLKSPTFVTRVVACTQSWYHIAQSIKYSSDLL